MLYWRIECGGSFVYVWIGHVMINDMKIGVRVLILLFFAGGVTNTSRCSLSNTFQSTDMELMKV